MTNSQAPLPTFSMRPIIPISPLLRSNPMKPFVLPLLALGILASTASPGAQTDRITLAGKWRFQLDRAKAGIEERWFERSLPATIKLPGSLPAQGIGDDVSVKTQWTGD